MRRVVIQEGYLTRSDKVALACLVAVAGFIAGTLTGTLYLALR